MSFFRIAVLIPALPVVLLMTGCGGGEGNETLASLDARLTNGAVPATDAAAPGNVVDAPQASAPRNPLDGPQPADAPSLGEVAERQRSERAFDRLRVATGGGTAREEADGCGRRIVYGDAWAQDLPAAFALYPGGTLVEAAGVSTERCKMRVVSFTADVTAAAIASHYVSSVKAAGYDAERRPCEDGFIVGGVHPRTGQAYVVLVTRAAGGSSSVDLMLTVA